MTHLSYGEADEAFHCITCSDEVLPAHVLSIDEAANLAVVVVGSDATATTEADISLVDAVAPGDVLLVHGGVALGHAQRLRNLQ